MGGNDFCSLSCEIMDRFRSNFGSLLLVTMSSLGLLYCIFHMVSAELESWFMQESRIVCTRSRNDLRTLVKWSNT